MRNQPDARRRTMEWTRNRTPSREQSTRSALLSAKVGCMGSLQSSPMIVSSSGGGEGGNVGEQLTAIDGEYREAVGKRLEDRVVPGFLSCSRDGVKYVMSTVSLTKHKTSFRETRERTTNALELHQDAHCADGSSRHSIHRRGRGTSWASGGGSRTGRQYFSQRALCMTVTRVPPRCVAHPPRGAIAFIGRMVSSRNIEVILK